MGISWLQLKNGDRGLKFKCGEEDVCVIIDEGSDSMVMFTIKDPKATNDYDLTERLERYGQREVAAMKTEKDLCDLWTRKTAMLWDESQKDWVYGEKKQMNDKNIRHKIAILERGLSDG